MTKQEILKLLRNGVKLNQIFDFISGQECEIYKSDDWTQAREDDIVYIPDISLNDICIDKNIHFEDERLYILRQFYRKKRFCFGMPWKRKDSRRFIQLCRLATPRYSRFIR